MFLVDMDLAAVAPAFAAQESNDQHQRLDTLKQFVVRHHTVSFFTTPEDLARLVLASLIRHLGVHP